MSDDDKNLFKNHKSFIVRGKGRLELKDEQKSFELFALLIFLNEFTKAFPKFFFQIWNKMNYLEFLQSFAPFVVKDRSTKAYFLSPSFLHFKCKSW